MPTFRNFLAVLYLLGNLLASESLMQTFRNLLTAWCLLGNLPASEMERLVSSETSVPKSSDAGRLPEIHNTVFNTRRKFEIKINLLIISDTELNIWKWGNLRRTFDVETRSKRHYITSSLMVMLKLSTQDVPVRRLSSSHDTVPRVPIHITVKQWLAERKPFRSNKMAAIGPNSQQISIIMAPALCAGLKHRAVP